MPAPPGTGLAIGATVALVVLALAQRAALALGGRASAPGTLAAVEVAVASSG